jgi:hypothetical protein
MSPSPPTAGDIARALAQRIESLARDLLPAGHREGAEWRAGSLAGEAGHSLGVHLVGPKSGVWSDFATGQCGDALDLVRAVIQADMPAALAWAKRWLGIEAGGAELPPRGAIAPAPAKTDPGRWRWQWMQARPIAGTVAERYLSGRRLHFIDPGGRVLRFASQRWRLHPQTGNLEKHPALLALLSDIHTGGACGIINIFLRADGTDRLRDGKGKTVTGRAKDAAVMLSAWDEPTYGLTICEGVETGISMLMAEQAPVWACGGAGTIASFPILGGIEALTIAADADARGQHAARACAKRWREAGREVAIVAPPAGDWADPSEASA